MVLFQQNFNQTKKNWFLNQSRIDTIMSRGTGITHLPKKRVWGTVPAFAKMNLIMSFRSTPTIFKVPEGPEIEGFN